MNKVIDEIIERVYNGDIPLEDGEFTVNGYTYTTVEIEGNWKVSYMGVNFNTYSKDCVCELFVGGASTGRFIYQHQERTTYVYTGEVEYRYQKCIEVKRQAEIPVINGWVKNN